MLPRVYGGTRLSPWPPWVDAHTDVRLSARPYLDLELGHGDGCRGGEGRDFLVNGGDHVGHRRRGGPRGVAAQVEIESKT